jgi:hypothetical protein
MTAMGIDVETVRPPEQHAQDNGAQSEFLEAFFRRYVRRVLIARDFFVRLWRQSASVSRFSHNVASV